MTLSASFPVGLDPLCRSPNELGAHFGYFAVILRNRETLQQWSVLVHALDFGLAFYKAIRTDPILVSTIMEARRTCQLTPLLTDFVARYVRLEPVYTTSIERGQIWIHLASCEPLYLQHLQSLLNYSPQLQLEITPF